METKKIFISYSTSKPQVADWVIMLANDLEEIEEFHVTYDKYDLDSTRDKNHFMENGIYEADCILIIITEDYVEKANSRKGGVGIETALLVSKHWDDIEKNGTSNIIPILREQTPTPNYLKAKIYEDFCNDDEYETSLQKLIKSINVAPYRPRPDKKPPAKTKPVIKNLTRNEDFLKINHKKRRLVFDKSETKIFSEGNRINFELWETRSPATEYYLFIFDNARLNATIKHFCQLLKQHKLKIRQLTLLRSNKGVKGLIDQLFKDNNTSIDIVEITFSDYIWEYCIDEEIKSKSSIYTQRFFIDQPLLSGAQSSHNHGPAFEYLKTQLNGDTQSSAYIVIAPGGTGKTTLCQYVAKEFQNPKNAVSVFIQSEEFRFDGNINHYNNINIDSVYDLYEIYAQVLTEQGNSTFTYDKTTFEVALITGKLVLVIDGLDEIISLFPNGFNLNSFLQSIDILNKQLALSKIIITSRNDVFDNEVMEKYEHLTKYHLLGFDKKACESYLRRRFRTLENSESAINKVLATIDPLIQSDENERILPFVVDLLSSLVEDTDPEDSTSAFTLSFEGKNYESNEEITDYLIYSVLRRESQRQRISLPIEFILEIFLEIASIYKETFSKDELSEIVSIYCEDDNPDLVVKFLRNPLLHIEGNQCRFKYSFISDYFKSIYIIHSINDESSNDDFLKLLAKNAYGDNEVMSGVTRYYIDRIDELIKKVTLIITKIKENISDKESALKNETLFRSLGFFTKLLSTIPSITTSKEAFTNALKIIYGSSTTIHNLCIYGSNPIIDFKDLTVVDSRFVGFKEFSRSSFGNSVFRNCYFDSCFNKVTSKTFTSITFQSCRLGDLEGTIENALEKSEQDRSLIEQELKAFFQSFFHRGSFTDEPLNHIRMSKKVTTINIAFLNKLIKEGVIIIKKQKTSGDIYEISQKYQDSVYNFLSNNSINSMLEKIISLVEKKRQ